MDKDGGAARPNFSLRWEKGWPLPGTQWRRLYLDLEGKRLRAEAPEGTASAAYEAEGQGVTFLAAPAERETRVIGPLAARLFGSSSTPDMDLFLVVHLFDPQGEEVVFQGAIGRADLVGGDFYQLMDSIRTQVLSLPDETRLLTGHGPETTVGWERRTNPFLVGQYGGELV